MRPTPPASVLEITAEPIFSPALDVIDWATRLFIGSGAALYNQDHSHLNFATIGALWTNVQNGHAGRRIVGQAEMGLPMGSKWHRGRVEMQLLQWFGTVPDFVLTFDADYCSQCSDAEFMALVEHELYHCGQERDEFELPKFTKAGKPKFGMRGHDVEEFVGVVRRYGSAAAHVDALVAAAKAGPEIAKIDVARACGTCQLRAA